MRKPAVYLAGRMSNNPYDVKWREDLTPFLEELGFTVLDPCKLEPAKLKGFQTNRLPKGYSNWQELHRTKEPRLRARFLKYMRAIIDYDIDIIKHKADMIIALWSKNCRTGAGTHSELTIALTQGKPVYAVMKAEMPVWANACCDKVFDSFPELRDFLAAEYEKGTFKGKRRSRRKKK